MAKNRKIDVVLGIAASIATILGFALTAYSMFFPNQLNDITGRFLGQIDADGKIRAEFVAGQLTLFFWTGLVTSLLLGLGMAGLWNWLAAATARAIAAGREVRNGYGLFLVFATLCILLGVYLPQAIFVPTNPLELQRQFPPAAWALRSPLGGVLVGSIMLAISLAVAWILFQIGSFMRRQKGKQYLRIMENS